MLGAGYSLDGVRLGARAGLAGGGTLAILTAYVRVLGGAIGTRQYFIGPMAKPQRMAVMTVACVLSVVEPLVGWRGEIDRGSRRS